MTEIHGGMDDFYQILTRAKAAIAQGIREISQADKSEYSSKAMRSIRARIKMLRAIGARIDDRRHVVGCMLDK